MTEYDIMYNWEDDIPTFFEWLEVACSLHKDSQVFKSLELTIRTKGDLNLFVDLFDGHFDRIERTASKYLLQRVS